jgi:hypothetical protein
MFIHRQMPPESLFFDWPEFILIKKSVNKNFILIFIKKDIDFRFFEIFLFKNYFITQNPNGNPLVTSKNDTISYAVIYILYIL